MATRFVIEGGVPLRGEVRVSAAKNAALPLLAATLLTEEPIVLERAPARRRDHHGSLWGGSGPRCDKRTGATIASARRA